MISVQVWDKSMVAAVEKAIRESSLGLNPVTEGQLLRIPIPELNEERRQELAKIAHKYAENAKIAVRHRDLVLGVGRKERRDRVGAGRGG